MEIVVLLIGVALAALAVKLYLKKIRRDRLMAKFEDVLIVDRIIKKEFWQGMTAEQLVEALGKPVEISQKSLKSKTVETYKYGKTGKNRFDLRVSVENGIVAGWQQN